MLWAGALPALNLPWEPTKTRGNSCGGIGVVRVLGDSGCCPLHRGAVDPREAPAPALEVTQRQHQHPRGLQSRKCVGEPSGVTNIQPGSRCWKRRYLLEELDSQEGRVAALVSIYRLLLSGPFGLDKLNTSRVHGESMWRSIQEIIHPSPLSGTG